MPDITYTLHHKFDGNSNKTHYAKIFSDGKHVENTPEVDNQLTAHIHGKDAIDRLSKVNESLNEGTAGSISVNMDHMHKWKPDQSNIREFDNIHKNKGKVLTLDTRPYEEHLNNFGIFYTKTTK